MASWLDEFTPNEYVSTVHDIDLDKLWKEGKRAILTDLDNTLVPWNQEQVPFELATWMKTVQDKGFKICIISNNKGPRVAAFSKATGIPAVSDAKKPKPDAFQKALGDLKVEASQTVMLGDQLFTDIRGGNLTGLHTILVLPINPREWWGTKIVRLFERRLMKLLIRRNRITVPRKSIG